MTRFFSDEGQDNTQKISEIGPVEGRKVMLFELNLNIMTSFLYKETESNLII